jgi:hypothetical protein
MKPVTFQGANRLFRGPEGSDIQPLPAFDEGQGFIVSCWEPSPEDLAALAAGGRIWLVVLGNKHPPVQLQTVWPFAAAAGLRLVKDEPESEPAAEAEGA